ncbi:hypothetical protein ACQ9ZH_16910 [Pseudomonas chlororaphis]
MSIALDPKKKTVLELFNAMAEMAYDQGVADGFAAGQNVGFVAGVNSLKGALARGLRHGSPECGKVLENFKRLGLEE